MNRGRSMDGCTEMDGLDGFFGRIFFNGRIGRPVHKDGRMYGFFRSMNEIRPSLMDGCTEKCKTFSDQGIKSPKIELFS